MKNNLNISKNTKIYVLAPACTATGGPELLHQLVYILNKQGLNAYMYYTPLDIPNPVHKAYYKYNNPFNNEIQDNNDNIIISSEQYKDVILLSGFKSIQKIIWWLSVDNFYKSMYIERSSHSFMIRALNKLSKLIVKKPVFDLSEEAMKYYKNINIKDLPFLMNVNLHLVQSHYALEHLSNQRIDNIDYLSDYLNDDYLNISDISTEMKENIVLYNPKKGYKFTHQLITNNKNINFKPIENMNRDEVIDIMKSSKVYIDFGNHPGKDRMTREAAMLGCCIITGKKGSSYFYDDVSIDKSYKFEDKSSNNKDVINKIYYCIDDYKKAIDDFEIYRNRIANEKIKFIEDVKKIFMK